MSQRKKKPHATDIKWRAQKTELKICEKLFYSSSIEDFLSLLYKEMSRHKIRTLILYHASVYFGPIQYVCHSKGIFKRFAKEYKPLDKKDSLYLADSLGRPIHHILRFSIPLKDTQNPAFLFMELNLKQENKGIDFYRSFSHLIESNVERLLRNEHLQGSIDLWTASFNSLEEPLAVFNEQKILKSANKAFDTLFKDNDQKAFHQESFQWKGYFFEKHSYPVNIEGDKYVIYHYVDVTESLHLRNKMIQNICLSALGQLGTNVAHQLNNPLTGILSMAQLLLNSGDLNKEEQKDIKDIAEGILRSQEIIASLLSFSRMDSHLTVCDLNTVVKKTIPFLKSLICWTDLQLELYPSPLLVQTQVCLLQQVVFNLIKNACQAVEDLDRSSRQICVRVHKKNNQALLYVEDSGQGISTSDYKNLFKPFWTTKREQGGTGLGLNISYDIVQSFKGNLTAGPSSLGGACFALSLPLQTDK